MKKRAASWQLSLYIKESARPHLPSPRPVPLYQAPKLAFPALSVRAPARFFLEDHLHNEKHPVCRFPLLSLKYRGYHYGLLKWSRIPGFVFYNSQNRWGGCFRGLHMMRSE